MRSFKLVKEHSAGSQKERATGELTSRKGKDDQITRDPLCPDDEGQRDKEASTKCKLQACESVEQGTTE